MNAIGVDETRTVLGRGQGHNGWDGSGALRRGRDPSNTAASLLLQGDRLHVGQPNGSQGSDSFEFGGPISSGVRDHCGPRAVPPELEGSCGRPCHTYGADAQ